MNKASLSTLPQVSVSNVGVSLSMKMELESVYFVTLIVMDILMLKQVSASNVENHKKLMIKEALV